MSEAVIESPVVQIPVESVHGPRLVGGWRITGIAFWAVIWLASLAAFLLAIFVWYRWDAIPIAIYAKTDPYVQADTLTFMTQYQDAIRQMGMSLPFYGGLFAALRLVSGIPYFILSILIMRRRSDRLMAVLFAITLAVIGAAGRWIQANWTPLPGAYPWTQIPILLLGFIMDSSVIMFYTFPDGRFVPRWTRWVALAALLYAFFRNILGNTPLNPDHLPGLLGSLPNRVFLLVGIFALAYRYARHANRVQKQQLKWIVMGSLLVGLFYFAHYLIYDTPLIGRWISEWTAKIGLLVEMILEPGWYVAQAVLAICIGLSIFRYRLWEIDLVINRVLVFGSLTLLTMGVYITVVGVLGSLFRGIADPVFFFLATGLVAILFEPLRRRLQRLVNRLMYGERDDPYAVLSRLANTLEHSPVPGETLQAIAATVGQALKIPYVVLQIQENGVEYANAGYGAPQPETLSFPLVYQDETIGTLRVAQRARGEAFSTADLRLIENIARQAGAAAQAVRLNAALIRSRAEIITAREEERRRLRRDLHDGLGPILSSQTLKMAAARQLIRQSPERAETLVDDVIQQNENTVSEVRRLVYGLRPPALDELGLVEAVRDLVRSGSQEGLSDSGLNIEIIAPPDGLPRLPAAVEVNAYRICLEALTNTARHSHARQCIIHFTVENDSRGRSMLLVQISDDGQGIPIKYRAGVGVRSMRERAEELGGGLVIAPRSPDGTEVSAWLPLA